MKSDLDRLMAERGIGGLIVPMHELSHPSFRWITRAARVTRGYALHRPGHATLLVYYPMERDEAAAAGLPALSIHELGYSDIFRANPDPTLAYAELYDRMLRRHGVEGEILFGGEVPVHLYLEIAGHLAARGWHMHRSGGEDVIQLARKRKEQWEIDAIASVGERTEQVVDAIRGLLRSVDLRDGVAFHQGSPLRIGDLKMLVSSEISRLGMIEDHETILSQGRDAGIPHSRGNPEALVRASVPLVIDIFPADRTTGYFFDLTRTFCIGPVPDRLARLHEEVLTAFEMAAETMRAGHKASEYQGLVCDFFESRGHPTTRSTPTTLEGYVHSLGHGVGLEVHERPSFSLAESRSDVIEAGDVLTIEPGLYYPGEEIGVRIEDTLFVREDGRVETLCRSPRGLVP
ncbi:MAG TPA: M24 family metallopeptidase [Thermoanaerobaculia bacterium]|nr:M24 family metallopeptidase [Thermoanaerobaculia bacterium]